jgi:YVTN family beta-propeller protein
VTRGTRALALGSPKQRALLALLLLHANELVPRDRLIEELWGDAAPATVNAALNGYLSKLRRMLADGVGEEILATRTPGYVLTISADQVDARRFEALLGEGRSALARGDAERAAATLREALSLWRGAALADLAYERFAQNEIGRLEELRLAALEERIEADLALGRHDALVAELEALAAQNPYRERLRAQLILALYRAGRQAEALEEYRRARETFVAELGIEPSPRLQELERAILRHDASLEAPAPRVPRPEMRLLGRRRRLFAVAAIGVVLAAAAAAVAGLRGRSATSRAPPALVGNSVVVIDSKTNSVDRELPIGGRPAGIAVGEGSIWVGNRDDKTLLRIDPSTRRIVRTIGLGAEPSDIAVGAGSVWVVSDAARSVLRVDPDSYDVAPPIRISRERDLCCAAKIVVGRGRVFVSRWSALWRIDPSTNAAMTIGGPLVRTIAYGENALWAITGPEYDIIERIEPGTHKVVDRFPLGRLGRTQGYSDLGFESGFEGAAGALWTASHRGGSLWKFDPFLGRVTGSIDLGQIPADMATGEGGLWVVSSVDGTVFRVDPEAERVVQRIRLGVFPPDAPTAIAAGAGAVWVITLSP